MALLLPHHHPNAAGDAVRYNDEATAWSQASFAHWVEEGLFEVAAVDVDAAHVHNALSLVEGPFKIAKRFRGTDLVLVYDNVHFPDSYIATMVDRGFEHDLLAVALKRVLQRPP